MKWLDNIYSALNWVVLYLLFGLMAAGTLALVVMAIWDFGWWGVGGILLIAFVWGWFEHNDRKFKEQTGFGGKRREP